MSQARQIIKSGQLQAKVVKKKVTLLRKKRKPVFGPEEWIVLCVHEDKIPLLEWYTSRATIFTHEPQKVVDLLYCQFCQINIGEDRCFTIGFNDPDRSAMEFAARNKDECESWINYLSSTLKRLNCIAFSENVYDPTPTFASLDLKNGLTATSTEHLSANSSNRQRSSPQLPRVLQLHDEIPFPTTSTPPPSATLVLEPKSPLTKGLPPSRTSTLENRMTHSTPHGHRTKKNSETVHENEIILDNPPPLPPRKSTSLESPLPMPTTNGSHNNEKNYAHQYDFPISPSSQYNQIRFSSTTKQVEELPPYDKICFRNADSKPRNENTLSVEHPNTSETSSSSGLDSFRFSVTSDPIAEEPYHLLPPPPPRPPKASSYDHIAIQNDSQVKFNDQRSSYDGFDKVKSISLLLTLCVEHIAFVEVGNKVWIAGWSEEKNSSLCGLIHVGDELVQIGDVEAEGMHQLPDLFYSQTIPGTPLRLKIRSLPHGVMYSLTKLENDAKSLGVVLHKKKNKIEDIIPRSPAAIAQIPRRVSPYLYGSSHVMPVITELDNVPLSLFASNDQFFKRLDRYAPGNSFTFVLHPQDFIRLIKEQMKHVKSARKYIQDS